MKTAQVISSFFIVGVKDFSFSKELQSFLKEFQIPSLALFNSPFDSPLNIWNDKNAALEAIYEFGIKTQNQIGFFSVDQEGGRVRRLRPPFIFLPSAQVLAEAVEETGEKKALSELYSLAARQMKLCRIGLNFAPNCDIRTTESSHVVGDRSYGERVSDALPFIEIFCKSFESVGVRTTLKHFPGHGPTKFDSHERIALVFKSKNELFNEDREIFLKAAKLSSALMTAHIAFEDAPERIFSLDQKLIAEFMNGIPKDLALITDDLLSMKAVSELKPWRKALDAGYDFLCCCGTLDQAVTAIEDSIRYFESKKISFEEEEVYEKRAKLSMTRFAQPHQQLAFSQWREQILELEQRGNDCLERLRIKASA